MFLECPNCRRRNPPNARFCATCGRRLEYARCGPAARSGGGGAALALGLVLIALFFGFRPHHFVNWGRRAVTTATASPTMRRDFNLSDHKADAFYHLIAPSDIKVIVGRRQGGVFIKGTPREAETMTDFAELLTRLEGRDGHTVEHIIKSLRSQPTETETYSLPRSKVQALINILKFEDVPVLVSGGGRKVCVIATPHDQQTIREVAKILRGER